MSKGSEEWDTGEFQKVLKHFHQQEISSVMKSNLWDMCYITPDAPIEDVITLISSRKHIWVVQNKKTMRLVGLITERNLIDVIAPRKVDPYNFSWTPSSLRSVLFGGVDIAEDIMATDLVSVKPTDKVGDALMKMKRHHLKRLPIVDHGRLVGEITIKSMIIKFKKVMKWNSVLKEYEVKKSKDG